MQNDEEKNSTGDIVTDVIDTGLEILNGTLDIIGDIVSGIAD